MTPRRIQLKRTKGWKMPPDTVKVDRSTKWGNPFRPREVYGLNPGNLQEQRVRDTGHAIELFLENLRWRIASGSIDIDAIRGLNLACWCKLCPEHTDGLPLGTQCDKCSPCHADALLIHANKESTP